jgi:hypothetical protein
MPRFAVFGPTDRYPPAPGGGMCISVFAIVRRDGKLLMGVPNRRKKWISEWVPNWGIYSKEDLDAEFKRWRLPAGYLLEGEHPDQALGRVMKDQLRVDGFKATSSRVLSYAAPSDWYPGNVHWDLVFVYDVGIRGPIKKLPWWRELKFRGRTELRDADFGWNDDFMRDLGLVG